jgi:multidrug efflux pump subunit AcrB
MSFNPSEWALKHRSLVIYLMIIAISARVFSCFGLGRGEGPSFIIKKMEVLAAWPGASVEDTPKQVVKCGEIVVTADVQTLHPGQKIRMVKGAS